ncbi:HAUS augmin-like complex subunit 5 isoform X3 [Grus americana]|uniref:HAUS augmin-like complex subunit 5 isoform X3 n=1 Tax=Grus americana TaxID=9117 RepID=UPI0024078DBE|nr:HAUS augmin-like complex subunit 5 isoform X3 [Grus americana]
MAAEAALGRWARTEMELPPGIDLSGTVLRRLCSGPCAPIWEFVTRHVRHPRNVKKIRGNLLWYRHLEMEGAGLAQAKEEARGAVSRLRQEVGGAAGGAPGRAREAVLELEAALEAELSRRGAELRRGLELRLMGAEATREGRRLREGRGNLRPPHRPGEAGPQLAAAIAMGMEPEVLASVRAVCRTRAEALESLLEPRPSLEAQELMEAATKRWLREAEAVLSRHPPGAVLWALEHLALDSARRPRPPGGARRRLRSYRPADCDLDADAGLDPAPEAEAPPTVRRLLQECWGAVGGVWGLLPALAARLRPQKLRLARLRQQIHQRLGGDPKSQWAARLALEAAGLRGARGALARGMQQLRGARGPPKPGLGEQKIRLQRGRQRLHRRQQRLRALAGATKTLKSRLRLLQGQVQGAGRAGLGGASPALAEESEQLRRLLGTLGGLGELGQPPPRPHPDPLLPVYRALELPIYQAQQGALCRAAWLRQELRLGAGLREWAWPAEPRPPLGGAVGGAGQELLPRLRLVAAHTRRRIEAWPRLQALVSQWWEQPAQWTLVPPPGGVPFSHWLQRWTRAAQALACPRPLPLAPPTDAPERRGQREPHP